MGGNLPLAVASEAATDLLSSRSWAPEVPEESMSGQGNSIRSKAPSASSKNDAEDLFESYYGRVKGFFQRRGCDEEEACELVQATFLRVSRSRSQLRDQSSEAGWMFTIAGNVWRSHVRDQKAEKRSATEVAIQGMDDQGESLLARQGLPPPGPNPLQALLSKERRQELHRAIAQLPPQMRACLELRITQDRKYREIAEILGVSVSTVKSQIFHAKAKLHELLKQALAENRA